MEAGGNRRAADDGTNLNLADRRLPGSKPLVPRQVAQAVEAHRAQVSHPFDSERGHAAAQDPAIEPETVGTSGDLDMDDGSRKQRPLRMDQGAPGGQVLQDHGVAGTHRHPQMFEQWEPEACGFTPVL